MPYPPGPLAEEVGQRDGVILVGVDGDVVYTGPAQGAAGSVPLAGEALPEGGAPLFVAGVYPGNGPRFRVFQGDEADVSQAVFQGVAQVYGDDVVPLVGHVQFRAVRPGVGDKVADQKEDAAPLENLVDGVQGQFDVCACAFGFEGEQFPHQAQDVFAPFARRDEQLNPVGEDEQAHFVVVGGGGEGEYGRNLRRHFPLKPVHRAKIFRRAHVHHEHHRQFPLFHVPLDVRRAGASGYVPVNGTNLIAGLVRPYLVKLHPLPLKDRMVLPGKRIIHHPPRPQFNAADFVH